MAAVRSRGNASTELRLISLLKAARIKGWRRGSLLPGRPDFVFPTQRVAIFVDGCFWHCCPKHKSLPATGRSAWEAKLAANQKRDRIVSRTLRVRGWNVIRIWEHDLTPSNAPRTIKRVERALDVILTVNGSAARPLKKARRVSDPV